MEHTIRKFILNTKKELLLFHLLDEEEMEQIIPILEIVLYQSGTIIFEEGKPGDFIGFIVSGRVEIKKETSFEGKDMVIATLGERSLVGGVSFVDIKGIRSATAVALKDSEIVILRREPLEAFMQNNPYTGLKILKGLNQVLAIRYQKCMERLADMF